MNKSSCPVIKKCGKCQSFDITYQQLLKIKEKEAKKLLPKNCTIHPIDGMSDPYHYRYSMQAVMGYQKGKAILGTYKSGSHIFVPVENCEAEDQQIRAIAETIKGLIPSFKMRIYDENSGYGFLRYLIVKKAAATGQVMVILVTASPVFPSKNNFVKALRQKHPEITTIIQNINERVVNRGLGNQEKILYGKGYIEDQVCGFTTIITSKSNPLVNPLQTEILYQRMITAAGLTGQETVFSGYGGAVVIGMMAGKAAKKVICAETNKDTVKNAADHIKGNKISNVQFYHNDAAKLLKQVAAEGESVDVVLMDLTKYSDDKDLFELISQIRPPRLVLVFHDLIALKKHLAFLEKSGYLPSEAWLVDTMPWTEQCDICIRFDQTKTASWK